MSGGWRGWALAASLVLTLAGGALYVAAGNPTILIIGLVACATSVLERTYGAPKQHPGLDMRPTGERFVDPETGQLVTVWSDPATGDRRYVADGERRA